MRQNAAGFHPRLESLNDRSTTSGFRKKFAGEAEPGNSRLGTGKLAAMAAGIENREGVEFGRAKINRAGR
jgi:hypothetical protein